MKDKDYIKELFSEKLAKHESPVRGDLWSGIQSQLGNTTSTTMAVKGISSSIKWMLGIASTVAVVGTTLWITSNQTTRKENSKEVASNNSTQPTNQSREEITTEKTPITGNTKFVIVAPTPSDRLPLDANVASINSDQTALRERHIGQDLNMTIQFTPVDDPSIQNSTWISPSNTSSLTDIIDNHQSAMDESSTTEIPTGKVEEFFNVFTPNGDGENDYFYLKTSNLTDFSIRIFNAKNELVFQSTDPEFRWFGLDANGNNIPSGNYGYVVFATDTNGKLIKVFKSLTIR